jgi:hypothetical protein
MSAPLSTTIATLLGTVLDAVPDPAALRITSFRADLPAEASLATTADGTPAVLIGPPQWRWRTDFDRPAGRMRMTVDVGVPEGEARP